MPHIVLTPEQTQTVRNALELVEVRDSEGRILAFLTPLDPHEVEAILLLRQRRASPSPEPAIPGARVHAMLCKLDEIDQREGITEEKVKEVLRKLRAGEEL
jgi:hypothetical protein